MSNGINKVILVGNCGQDPEVRYLPNGGAVANLSLATSESWTDKNSGQKQEKTEWHRIAFFGKLADVVAQYVKKGSKLYVEGKLQTRKWQDQSGNDKYTTEIVVDGFGGQMQMLGGRSPDGAGNQQQQPQQQAPKQPQQQYQAAQQNAYQQAQNGQMPQQSGKPAMSQSNPYQNQPQQPNQPQGAPAGHDDFNDDPPF